MNTDNNIVTVSLPLLSDPEVKLNPNKDIAEKVYHQQLRKVQNDAADKASIIKSEQKLQDLGFVSYVKDLPEEVQHRLSTNPVQNFIPWRIAWKPNSPTTPCRLVFDASMSTSSGYSLNDILPKGVNNLNKLLEIFLRWHIYPVAYHNDINKMYNGLKLKEEFWGFQRYLFEPNLDPSKKPFEKNIKTAIYRVRPSGKHLLLSANWLKYIKIDIQKHTM